MSWPERRPGTYALVLYAPAVRSLEIGRLGTLHIERGYYVYAGSAFGPGGLPARLRHHLKPALRPHWHIDYLRPATRLVEVWHSCDDTAREHAWAEALRRMRLASTPLAGFGSSDCRCPSHLSFHAERPAHRSLRHALRSSQARCAILHRLDGSACVGTPRAG